jgi:hypothetical protein
MMEHVRQLAELTTECDEPRRACPWPATSDAHKRNETELAAVQTISDRNAELRANAAAISSRRNPI